MLYTVSKDGIERILQRTRYLAWDDADFLVLAPAEVEALQKEIQMRYSVMHIIRDGARTVTIYR